MIIDAKSGLRGVLVDADTGQRLPFARWANLETGEYEALAATPDGRRKIMPPRVIRGRARLRWIPAAPRFKPSAKIEIPDDGRPERRGRRIIVVAGQECEVRGCHRLAEFSTAAEQELEPGTASDGRKWERAETVEVHLFCPWHFRNPTFTSRRGVESEVQVKVRPD